MKPINRRTARTLAFGFSLLAAFPAFSQDRTVVAQSPEKATKAAPDSPFGAPIKVEPSRTPARAQAQRTVVAEQPVQAAKPMPVQAVDSPAKPVASQVWRLEPGLPLHVQLRGWAELAGWQLEWKVPRSWIVPARSEFVGRFDEALEKVVLSLTNEGKPLQLNIWEGNYVAEVLEVAPR